MNKVILEVGLLAFCLAAVAFGVQGMDVMEIVARAFLVFMSVVCGIAMVLLVSTTFRARAPRVSAGSPSASAQEQGTAAQQSAETAG